MNQRRLRRTFALIAAALQGLPSVLRIGRAMTQRWTNYLDRLKACAEVNVSFEY